MIRKESSLHDVVCLFFFLKKRVLLKVGVQMLFEI